VEAGAGRDGGGFGRGTVRPQPPMNNTTPAKTKIGWRMRVSSNADYFSMILTSATTLSFSQ